MGIHVLMNNTANFYNTYVTAVALDAISWKYYLVFVALNIVYGEDRIVVLGLVDPDLSEQASYGSSSALRRKAVHWRSCQKSSTRSGLQRRRCRNERW